MKTLMPVLLIAIAFSSAACGKTGADKPAEKAAATDGKVTVSAEGKKFEPPIKPEQLPEGAWYCDMGTVHYARMDKGDGTCPVCQMQLKQK